VGTEPEGRGRLGPTGRLFYLDASLQLPVCRALALVRDDVVYAGGPDSPISSTAVRDEDWLPVVGAEGMLVLMRDKHIRSRRAERDRLIENGVGAFCLTGAGNTLGG
jgi:PIN like domain